MRSCLWRAFVSHLQYSCFHTPQMLLCISSNLGFVSCVRIGLIFFFVWELFIMDSPVPPRPSCHMFEESFSSALLCTPRTAIRRGGCRGIGASSGTSPETLFAHSPICNAGLIQTPETRKAPTAPPTPQDTPRADSSPSTLPRIVEAADDGHSGVGDCILHKIFSPARDSTLVNGHGITPQRHEESLLKRKSVERLRQQVAFDYAMKGRSPMRVARVIQTVGGRDQTAISPQQAASVVPLAEISNLPFVPHPPPRKCKQ